MIIMDLVMNPIFFNVRALLCKALWSYQKKVFTKEVSDDDNVDK